MIRRIVSYIRRNAHYARPGEWRSGGKALYRRFSRSGIFIEESELGLCSLLPARALEKTRDMLVPRSVLDVGCGTGKALDWWVEQGADALGIEGSALAKHHANNPDRIAVADLRQPIDVGREFDLVWCFEVAEHIHAKYTSIFMDTLARHSDVVVMSAAPPGQGGEGHFNEQPRAYWVSLFQDRGFSLDASQTAALNTLGEFYCENLMVFRRAS